MDNWFDNYRKIVALTEQEQLNEYVVGQRAKCVYCGNEVTHGGNNHWKAEDGTFKCENGKPHAIYRPKPWEEHGSEDDADADGNRYWAKGKDDKRVRETFWGGRRREELKRVHDGLDRHKEGTIEATEEMRDFRVFYLAYHSLHKTGEIANARLKDAFKELLSHKGVSWNDAHDLSPEGPLEKFGDDLLTDAVRSMDASKL